MEDFLLNIYKKILKTYSDMILRFYELKKGLLWFVIYL